MVYSWVFAKLFLYRAFILKKIHTVNKLAATIKPSSNLHAGFFIIEVMSRFFLFIFFLSLFLCTFVTACQNNTYGAGCSKKCGHCLNKEQCNHIKGTCHNGCEAGYYSPRCKKGILPRE